MDDPSATSLKNDNNCSCLKYGLTFRTHVGKINSIKSPSSDSKNVLKDPIVISFSKSSPICFPKVFKYENTVAKLGSNS